MKVLLIKLSSMGDLIHTLPALTDAYHHNPHIQFDWVIDESFQNIPNWHPAVNRCIISAHRRWKKNKMRSFYNGDLYRFYQTLNAQNYDVVIDAQGNLKSAVIGWLHKGAVHGMNKKSIKEKPAHLLYRYQYNIPKKLHAIRRIKLLFSYALKYKIPDMLIDYGVPLDQFTLPKNLPLAKKRYLIFVHSASWNNKLWPEEYWHYLTTYAEHHNYYVLFPHGNQQEHARSVRLASGHDNAIILEKTSLTEMAALLKYAQGAVCCDTGLCHIAGMVNVPSIALFGPTDPQLVGPIHNNQEAIVADKKRYPCAPCYQRKCYYNGHKHHTAACMPSIKPETVWRNLQQLMEKIITSI